jgi:hypothetical protein
MQTNFLLSAAGIIASAATLVGGTVSAATPGHMAPQGRMPHAGQAWEKSTITRRLHGVLGTVSSINGTSFTVTTVNRFNSTTPNHTFTVNTSTTTTYTKDGQAATLTDLATGERVMIQGTVDTSSLTIAATKVNIVTKKPALPETMKRMIHKADHMMSGRPTEKHHRPNKAK